MRQTLSNGWSRSLGFVWLTRRPQQWQSDKLGWSRVLFSGGGGALVVEEEDAGIGSNLGFRSEIRSFLEGKGEEEGGAITVKRWKSIWKTESLMGRSGHLRTIYNLTACHRCDCTCLLHIFTMFTNRVKTKSPNESSGAFSIFNHYSPLNQPQHFRVLKILFNLIIFYMIVFGISQRL